MRFAGAVLLGLLAAAPAAAQGQAPPPPPSGRPPSGAATPMPQMGGPFMGGVPAGTATEQPIALTIGDAINRALEHNLGVLTAEEAVGHANGARWIALSELLPNVNGHISESRQLVNFAVFGFPVGGDTGFPAIGGPFNVFDARVFLSQSVLDFSRINNLRAESHNVAAAKFSYKSARDLVVLVSANLYLQALASSARADSAKAQLDVARALYNQAVDLRKAGIVAGIDVIRAEVELATEQQRATATDNEFQKTKLQLARVIGLPVGQTFTLSGQIPYAPVPDMTLEEALQRAYKARPDYLAALERLHAAEASRAAIVSERLPSVHVTADYGDIGLDIATSHYTYTLGGMVNVPIFQGGRVRGRLLESDADLRDRRSELEDLKAGIYYDVRTAFLDLRATGEQLEVATRARELAAQQLTQSRDRFAAGVASNIEVVEAQQAVASANEQYINGLYTFNVSKAALARALGVAEEAVRQYLGGAR